MCPAGKQRNRHMRLAAISDGVERDLERQYAL
jgi:hypothetical protein